MRECGGPGLPLSLCCAAGWRDPLCEEESAWRRRLRRGALWGRPARPPPRCTEPLHILPRASVPRTVALLCSSTRPPTRLPPIPYPPSLLLPTALTTCRSNYNQLSQTTQASQTITTVSGAKTYLGAYGLRSSPAGLALDQAFIDSVAPIMNSASQNQYNMMALQVCVCGCVRGVGWW